MATQPDPTRARVSGPVDEAIATERRRWLAHLALYLVAQVVLALLGHSWPYAALTGQLTWEEIVTGNMGGGWPLQASRIWTFVIVADTIWSWARIARWSARARR
ncbi:hypothetical protein O7627_00750 [Solwaraspora sp. WMMD1047]|uniref:hypothetical protein n=1 Tax=Solwaraspora sp. WMMD1047 TaxID=3016102 RepID=UPI00241708A1|nr:hypothetical protein [Solwaraspora sp. WMMD1047]MDG4827828.1 hypothetical protein [Solwaraspora sp. WMMD1047]